MKISYFNYHYNITQDSRGGSVQVESLAEGLRKLGHSVDIGYRNIIQQDEPSVKAALKKVGWLRKYVHGPKRILKNYPDARAEKRMIREFGSDVLLSIYPLFGYSAVMAARACRVPLVAYFDAPMEYEATLFIDEYSSYRRLARMLERRTARAADEIICITEILKAYLVNYGIDADRITVVPNGADCEKIKPMPPDEELLDTYNLRGKRIIGFIGSFNFFSDQPAMLDALTKICHEFSDVHFLFVGKGNPWREKFRDKMASRGLAGRFTFPGGIPHDEVSRYLSLMYAAITPYRGDYLFYGSSMKVIEYMAAGVPCVVPALGQIKELINDGYNGYLYQWDDFEMFYQKLHELLKNPDRSREAGVNARATIVRNWTWDHQAKRIERVLQRAVDNYRK